MIFLLVIDLEFLIFSFFRNLIFLIEVYVLYIIIGFKVLFVLILLELIVV